MLVQWALAQQVWLRNPLEVSALVLLAVVAVEVAAERQLVEVAAVLPLWARLVCPAQQAGPLLRAQQEAA